MIIKVKKTKAGKFSVELSHHDRATLFNALSEFMMEDAAMKLTPVLLRDSVLEHMYASVIDHVLRTKDFGVQFVSTQKIQFNRHEAVAIMWTLRKYDGDMGMLTLKSQLHKLLS